MSGITKEERQNVVLNAQCLRLAIRLSTIDLNAASGGVGARAQGGEPSPVWPLTSSLV